MPSWLRGFATYQPLSEVISAARALMIGGPASNHVVISLVWSVGIFVVLAPLAVWRYRTRS
jgi:oleandomycin transport system permease protein